MNRITYIYTIGLISLITSCVDTPASDDYRPTGEPHYLNVDKTEMLFGSDASSKSINIYSSENWVFSDYASWLDLSQGSGAGSSQIKISAEENFSADKSRTSIFYLKSLENCWNFGKTMRADQKAAKPYIVFSPELINAAGGASSARINVSANTSWSTKCDADWLVFTVANDLSYIDLNIFENLTNKTRTATIIVSGATTETFTITQNVANLESEIGELEYAQSGGSYLLKINSEVTWSATTSSDWIDLSPEGAAAGETLITVSTTPNWDTNKRNGTVVFYVGDYAFATILILQEGVKLIAPEQISFRALGESKTIEVEGNISWNVLSKPSWITISPDRVDGNSKITILAENNSEATSRTGIIKLGKEGVTHTAEITVSQDGKYFSVNNEELAIGSKGGTMQVDIATNDSWFITLLSKANWLTISNKQGEENLTIDFVAEDNASVNPRTETAVITPRDLSEVNVIIRQSARYLTVNSNGVQFFSKGGSSIPVIISTDGEYSISEQTDWFSVSRDGDIVIVTADVNETGHTRTGDITITVTDLIEGSLTLTITVTQIAPGGNFNRKDYNDDNLWDATYSSMFTISVIGYSDDENWDAKEHHGVTVTIDGYKSDENWDNSLGSGNIEAGEFPDDDNYDNDKFE